MKIFSKTSNDGFTLIELIVVMAIIVMLTSVLIPHYAEHRKRAQATGCLANRKTIEKEEAAHFAQAQSPSLTINSVYQCPSGGVYVWLVSDPEDPAYPKVACSVHYAGSQESSTQETESPPETPGEAIERLSDYVKGLDLPDKVETALLKRLETAKNRYEKDKINKSVKTMEVFKKQIQKNRKKIDDQDEAYLKSKADEIQESLKELQ